MKRGRLLWGFGGGQTEKAPPFLKGTAEPERILDLGRRSRSFDAAFLEGGFLYHHGKDQGKDGAGQEEHQSAHVVPLKDAVYGQQADEAPAIGAQLHQAFGGALGDGIGGFVAQDLLLADEPTGALDSRSSDELLRLFGELNRGGQTIVMVTHSVRAASTAGRVLFIKDGEVFHQLYRGGRCEEQFYQEISGTLTLLATGGMEQ